MTGAPGDKGASLRARQAQLEERSHDALLELYSIETQLERARTRVVALDRAQLRLERESVALRRDLRQARKVISTTQRNLGARVRALYEQGGVEDPIAIIFGAESIDDAVNRLEGLEQIISQQKVVLHQALDARSRLLRVKSDLAKRKASLARLHSQALASSQSLSAAVSAKRGTIAKLSSQKAFTGRQLQRLSTRASRAAETSLEAERRRGKSSGKTTSTSSGTTTSEPDDSGGSGNGEGPSGERKLTVSATCYCLKGTTASGLPVGPGIVATDPTVIPLGTRMYVPGYGDGVAADTGSAVKGLTIDLWVESCAQASAYGRRTLTITVY